MTPRASHPKRKARAVEHQQWEGCAAQLPWPPCSWLGCLPERGGLSPSSPLASPPTPSPGTLELLPQGDASPLPGVGKSSQSTFLPEAAEEPDHPLSEALLNEVGRRWIRFSDTLPHCVFFY